MMPSPKFCDLLPTDAAVEVKRMLGHAPSQQAAHTFWSNLTTLGKIQQNQRLEIDSQGVFRLESTASRKVKTLSPFGGSRSITELYPDVLRVLYRAQIESFFPTPQLSKVLGSKLAITENQTYNRDGNRRSIVEKFVEDTGVVAPPPECNDHFFGNIQSIASQVIAQVAHARAGLTNMLAGYRSQNSWFNSKGTQAACVEDLVGHAEKHLMPFDLTKPGSIAPCLAFKLNTLPGEQLAGFWHLDREKINAVAQKDFDDRLRIVSSFLGASILVNEQDRQNYGKQGSMLLWGHHVLRDDWVYRDLDFDLFDNDIFDDLGESSRVLEEAVGLRVCNVNALGELGGYVRQQISNIRLLRNPR
jgi:hypothetical protein